MAHNSYNNITHGPAYENTDDAAPDLVLSALRQCAAGWEPQARLLGNVRAIDISRAITTILTQIGSPLA